MMNATEGETSAKMPAGVSGVGVGGTVGAVVGIRVGVADGNGAGLSVEVEVAVAEPAVRSLE